MGLAVIDWLLEGEPWVQYHTRLSLLGQGEADAEVISARQAMRSHAQVRGLLAGLADWPGEILKSHKNASHPLHQLAFLADLGLELSDPGVAHITDRILEHQAAEGPFQVRVNIKPAYGGTGEDQYSWMLCDAPLVLYALVKFGLAEDARVQAAIQYLAGLIRENGWPCAVAPELGRFHGPGRRSDPCPYANLAMLKLLALLSAWRDRTETRTGVENLLLLWERRRESRPYLFGMGSDFTKLKTPLIWYDILHLMDVLSQFPWACNDPRLGEMRAIVETKADAEGRYTPESVWMAWKEWDFGQKRDPSRWLTLIVLRMLKRMELSSLG